MYLVRFELTTTSFGGKYSIQLSYRYKSTSPKHSCIQRDQHSFKRRIQESNLLAQKGIGFRNQRITVLPTLLQVSPVRFERTTSSFAGRRSIQLSYGLISNTDILSSDRYIKLEEYLFQGHFFTHPVDCFINPSWDRLAIYNPFKHQLF